MPDRPGNRVLVGWLALGLVLGCPQVRRPAEATGRPPSRPPVPTSALVSLTSTKSFLPAGEPVVDDGCGCSVPVPDGWSAYRVDGDPTLIVRLERTSPPAMRIEIHRGDERAPNGNERFFDRGPYLDGSGAAVRVWADRDPDRPDVRRFGVLLQDSGRAAVALGWIPDEDFEAAKRAFDGVVGGIAFTGESVP